METWMARQTDIAATIISHLHHNSQCFADNCHEEIPLLTAFWWWYQHKSHLELEHSFNWLFWLETVGLLDSSHGICVQSDNWQWRESSLLCLQTSAFCSVSVIVAGCCEKLIIKHLITTPISSKILFCHTVVATEVRPRHGLGKYHSQVLSLLLSLLWLIFLHETLTRLRVNTDIMML